jgi:hypothetical protein
MIQAHKNARANEYASLGDFCRIHVEQMNSLYLLSLLLTADTQKAEQCFISGFDDSVSHRFVFKERASFWARRSIILQAIRFSLCILPLQHRPPPINRCVAQTLTVNLRKQRPGRAGTEQLRRMRVILSPRGR